MKQNLETDEGPNTNAKSFHIQMKTRALILEEAKYSICNSSHKWCWYLDSTNKKTQNLILAILKLNLETIFKINVPHKM